MPDREPLCARFPDLNFVPDPFLGEESMPAKQVCVHCPVREECRVAGERDVMLGVWGGEDERDRVVRQGVPPERRCRCHVNAVVRETAVGAVCTGCGVVTT